MQDLVPQSYVPRKTLVRQGITAVGSLASALVLFILKNLPSVAGLIAGGIITLAGLVCVFSKDKEDKKAGLFLSAAGILSLLSRSPLFPRLSGGLLNLGILGLLGLGVWKGVAFLRGLKARG
ncbi:MAG: hypothetical protein LBK64_06030 [Spirochaetaceae bacterium]|jgi:hypothetical protein|nr:hypothetical protein [Spirochaetaceae bacterium]